MPNPYHDETGRFCSKEEMGQAVERLATAVAVAGDDGASGFQERYQKSLDAYFELRREYDAINRGVTEMPEDWVSSIATSASVQSMPDTAAGIEAFYRAGLSDALRQRDDQHVYKAVDIYTHENTPQWIKDDIHRDASVEIKAALINHLSYGEKYPEITSSDLLPFTWGDNGHSPKVTRALLNSNRLGFDTKYELAKDRGQLGWFISQDSRVEAVRYDRIPDIENDLRREWASPLRPAESRTLAAFALARNTQDVNLRAELLEKDTRSVVNSQSIASEIAKNKNLSQTEGIALLARTVRIDSQNFELVYSNLSDAQRGGENPLRIYYNTRVREITSTKDYKGAGELRLGFAQTEVFNHYGAELDAGISKYPGFDRESDVFAEKVLGADRAADYWHQLAVIDAEPGRYEGLRKESKRLEKAFSKTAGRGDRDEAKSLLNERDLLNGRILRAKNVRVASLMVEQVQQERERAYRTAEYA